MGVNIDPARRHQQTVGIDRPPRRSGLAAHRSDLPVIDRDIAAKGRCTGAVDDGAAANDDVVHGRALSLCAMAACGRPAARAMPSEQG